MQLKKVDNDESSNIDFEKEFSCYNVDIGRLSKYLIQLYFRTSKKYSCSSSKIDSLLLIYKLCCIKEGLNTFNGRMVLYRDTFLKFEFTQFFPTCILNSSVEEDGKAIWDSIGPVIELGYTYQSSIPEEYLIGTHAKKLLVAIFRTFGNYSSLQLKQMIHELYLPYVEVSGHIVLKQDQIYRYFNFSKDNDNEIFKFVSQFKSECDYTFCYKKDVYDVSDLIKEVNMIRRFGFLDSLIDILCGKQGLYEIETNPHKLISDPTRFHREIFKKHEIKRFIDKFSTLSIKDMKLVLRYIKDESMNLGATIDEDYIINNQKSLFKHPIKLYQSQFLFKN